MKQIRTLIDSYKTLVITAGVALLFLSLRPMFWPGGGGFGEDQSVTKNVETDAQGNVTKTVETTTSQAGKSLWDWLSLVGVPLSLVFLGVWLQRIEKQRAEDESREEALQVYFDRVSALLVDKNLIAIANAKDTATDEQKALLDTAADVLRARTLSILRRFNTDYERKTSVMTFLVESEVISKLKLSLSSADLSGINLSGADLSGANLSELKLCSGDLRCADLTSAKFGNSDFRNTNLYAADLRNADFSSADLSGANFVSSDLRGANLRQANLSGAKLNGVYLGNVNLCNASLHGAELRGTTFGNADLRNTDFSNADFSNANLHNANLSGAKNLTDKQLQTAKLCDTLLPEGINMDPYRDCSYLGIEFEEP